jgi:hypothetical protein
VACAAKSLGFIGHRLWFMHKVFDSACMIRVSGFVETSLEEPLPTSTHFIEKASHSSFISVDNVSDRHHI